MRVQDSENGRGTVFEVELPAALVLANTADQDGHSGEEREVA